MLLLISATVIADELCFSPVKEKKGDKSTKRKFFQSFDYKIQVDDGPIIKPSSEDSTSYEFHTDSPMVKIWLGGKVVESFRVSKELLSEGRSCIYLKICMKHGRLLKLGRPRNCVHANEEKITSGCIGFGPLCGPHQ